MEKVDADDHPLSSSSVTHRASKSLFSESRSDPGRIQSPAASLIRSAARSILDDATPNTAFSDDESESLSCADGNLGNLGKISIASPSLSSLRIQKMPALPDEQDRKRFIVSGFYVSASIRNGISFRERTVLTCFCLSFGFRAV